MKFFLKICSLSLLSLALFGFTLGAQAQTYGTFCNNQARSVCGDSGNPATYQPGGTCEGLFVTPTNLPNRFACDASLQDCFDGGVEVCIQECNLNPANCIPDAGTATSPAPTAVRNSTNSIDTRQIGLVNPLGVISPFKFVDRILTAVFGIAGLITLVMFIYSGLLYLVSSGQESLLAKAKSTMTYSVVGLIVIMAAYVVVNTIFTAVTAGGTVVGGSSSPTSVPVPASSSSPAATPDSVPSSNSNPDPLNPNPSFTQPPEEIEFDQ
jgi:hypothetical protein